MKWFDLGALFTPSEKTKLAGIATAATKYPDTGEQAFLDADHTKLNGIDTGAKDDQTGAEIKTAYEGQANAYTDTKNTKLAGIDTGADVTGSNPPQAHAADKHTDRTRHLWLASPHKHSGGAAYYGIYLDSDTDEDVHYSFMCPPDFVSIGNVYVYYKSEWSGGNIVLNASATYYAADEATGTHSDSDIGNVISTPNQLAHRFTTSGLLTSLAVGDTGVIYIRRDADHASDTNAHDITLIGILIEYVADM